jgi:hypothetical protein
MTSPDVKIKKYVENRVGNLIEERVLKAFDRASEVSSPENVHLVIYDNDNNLKDKLYLPEYLGKDRMGVFFRKGVEGALILAATDNFNTDNLTDLLNEVDSSSAHEVGHIYTKRTTQIMKRAENLLKTENLNEWDYNLVSKVAEDLSIELDADDFAMGLGYSDAMLADLRKRSVVAFNVEWEISNSNPSATKNDIASEFTRPAYLLHTIHIPAKARLIQKKAINDEQREEAKFIEKDYWQKAEEFGAPKGCVADLNVFKKLVSDIVEGELYKKPISAYKLLLKKLKMMYTS